MASKEQKEGMARVFDTLAASAVIGAVVGMAGHGLSSLVMLFCFALWFRPFLPVHGF